MELVFMNFQDYEKKALEEGSEPIIGNLIDRKDFVILSATAKTGKSMLALHIALSITSGKEFLGMNTQLGKVLYLQTEIAPYQLMKRIDLMLSNFDENENDLIRANLFICDQSFKLDRPSDFNSLKKVLQDQKPSLLILDPFYTLHSKKEDSSDDMAPILTSLKVLAKENDCAILLIHHQGKKSEHSGSQPGHSHRGSSSFGDVPDASLSLIKRGSCLTLKGEFRNRSSLDPIEYTLEDSSLKFTRSGFTPKKMSVKEYLLVALKNPDEKKRSAKYLQTAVKEELGVGKEGFNKAIGQLNREGILLAVGSSQSRAYQLQHNLNYLEHCNTLPS